MGDDSLSPRSRRLRVALEEARPGWGKKDVQSVEKKLKQIGIADVESLYAQLDLVNSKLKRKGLKLLSSGTLQELKVVLEGPGFGFSPAAQPAGRNEPSGGLPDWSFSRVVVKEGLPAGNKTREELIKALEEGERLGRANLQELQEMCRSRGLFYDKEEDKATLKQRLIEWNWELEGVPIARLANLDEAQDLLAEVQQLQKMTENELEIHSRNLGLHSRVGDGKNRLLEELQSERLWRRLSKEELERECEDVGLTPKPGRSCDELIQELKRSTWIEHYEAAGVPARRLGDMKSAEELHTECMRLEKLPDSKLEARYGELPFPVDSRISRQEMIRRVKAYTIWQRMPVSALQKECSDLGLTWKTKGFALAQREHLQNRLVTHLCASTWQAFGIPADHLSLKVATQLAEAIENLEHLSDETLEESLEYSHLDGEMSRTDILRRMRLIILWQELPCSILREECERKGIALEATAEGESDEQRGMLADKLLLWERAERWRQQGVPVHRLQDLEAALELRERERELDEMPLAQVQEEYKALGLPSETGLTRTCMVDLLKKNGFFWALSWEELLKECANRGLTLPEVLENVVNTDDLWMEHCYRLTRKLIETECMDQWDLRGYPIERLRNFDAAALLVERYEQIQSATSEQLVEECASLGLPTSADMPRALLSRRLRARALWRGLSVTELIQECKLRDLPLHDVLAPATGPGPDRTEVWQRTQLVRKLGTFETLVAWEEEGYQALRIGDVEAVRALAKHCGRLHALGPSELQAAYAKRGLPEEEVMERHTMLSNLKTVLEWEAMPVSELEKDCQERQLRMPHASPREALVEKLVMDLASPVLACQGVNVDSVPTLRAAAGLSRRFEQIMAMDKAELQKNCVNLGMRPSSSAPAAALQERLRQAASWEEMAPVQLRAEIEDRVQVLPQGVVTAAQCREYLLLLMCLEDFNDSPVEAFRLHSIKVVETVERQLNEIKAMSVTELLQRSGSLRLPCIKKPPRQWLVDLLSKMALWEVLSAEELRVECQNTGISQQQQVSQALPQEDQRRFLRELLMTRECQPALDERGIPSQEVQTLEAGYRLVQVFDKLGAMSDAEVKQEYKGLGLVTQGVSTQDMLVRLRQIHLWKEAPLPTVQKECRKLGINSIARESEKATLVQRLVKARWAEPSPEEQRQKEQRERQQREEHQRRQERQQQQRSGQGSGATQRSAQLVATHLRTLGLQPPMNLEDVKKAYKKLALKYHPDKNKEDGAEENFRMVVEAYQFLTGASSPSSKTSSTPPKTSPPPPPPKPTRPQPRSADTAKQGVATLGTNFALVGSWNDWTDFEWLVGDGSGIFAVDVVIPKDEEVEFQVLCDGKWDRRLYPSATGSAFLGPAGEDEAHGVNWRLPPQGAEVTLRVQLRPKLRRLECFEV